MMNFQTIANISRLKEIVAVFARHGFEDVIRYLANSIDVIIQMGRQGDRRGIVEVFVPGGD